jgi:peptide/nickel transport system substrate-binding protein
MKKVLFVTALVAMVVAIPACAAPAQPTPAPAAPQAPAATVAPTKAAQPKTLVVCMAQEPESLYVHGTNMAVATYTGQAGMFDGALGGIDQKDYDYQAVIFTKLPSITDGDAKLVKAKVKAGDSISDAAGTIAKADKDMELDQIVATFKLKPNLKWSDGDPLTAKDFVFTFNTLKDKDSGVTTRFVLDRTASYVAKDDSTLEWTGLPGFTYSLYNQVSWVPIPEHVLKT